jgi:hypothetical protein
MRAKLGESQFGCTKRLVAAWLTLRRAYLLSQNVFAQSVHGLDDSGARQADRRNEEQDVRLYLLNRGIGDEREDHGKEERDCSGKVKQDPHDSSNSSALRKNALLAA